MSLASGLRVGVLVPENNTTVERELPLWLPTGSTIELIRIPRGKGLLDAGMLPAYQSSALELAQQFAARNLDVIAYGCTAASFILGPAGDDALGTDLSRVTGKPVATIARSMVEALLKLDVQRLALVTPYSKVVNEQLKSFIESTGIKIGAFESFYAADVDALQRINASDVMELARKTMKEECDAMFIACAQLPTFEVLDQLQAEFRRPVLSSVQSLAESIRSKFHGGHPDSPHFFPN